MQLQATIIVRLRKKVRREHWRGLVRVSRRAVLEYDPDRQADKYRYLDSNHIIEARVLDKKDGSWHGCSIFDKEVESISFVGPVPETLLDFAVHVYHVTGPVELQEPARP